MKNFTIKNILSNYLYEIGHNKKIYTFILYFVSEFAQKNQHKKNYFNKLVFKKGISFKWIDNILQIIIIWAVMSNMNFLILIFVITKFYYWAFVDKISFFILVDIKINKIFISFRVFLKKMIIFHKLWDGEMNSFMKGK